MTRDIKSTLTGEHKTDLIPTLSGIPWEKGLIAESVSTLLQGA